MCVTDGVDVWVGLGVAGAAWAHAVLLLAEQSGGLPWAVLRAGRGRRLLAFGRRGQRRVGARGAQRCARRGVRGVVAGRGRGLRQRLARPAAGGGGCSATRWNRLGVGELTPHRGRGQRQRAARPRRCDRGQRDRRVQAGVTALWRLRRAVQVGCQETVLILSTSDLMVNREANKRSVKTGRITRLWNFQRSLNASHQSLELRH